MVSLFGRKRTSELSGDKQQSADVKKDELLALKLEEMNTEARQTGSLQVLPTDMINADPNQPRKVFRHIDSLAASVKQNGIIQPIIVSEKNEDGIYTIIAGERRYRAAIQAGITSIPCIVRDESDANIVILQLLENDQREDVSPLEESDALCKLINEMDVNKTSVAKELGRDIGWISIRLGLQKASTEIKDLVKDGLVEDIRTLHELRMFEKEQPQKAQKLIQRIRGNTISGTYRQVIADARSKTKKRKPEDMVRDIIRIERYEDEVILHVVGKKRPVRYRISEDVLESFVESIEETVEGVAVL